MDFIRVNKSKSLVFPNLHFTTLISMVNNPQNCRIHNNKKTNIEFSYFTLNYNILFTRLNTTLDRTPLMEAKIPVNAPFNQKHAAGGGR